MDIRISHRFGDMFGQAGGWPTFYGLENASDIMIGAEFGLTNNIMLGVNRTKGAGDIGQNINTFLKVRLITQETGARQPLSLAFVGMTSVSTQEKSPTPGVLTYFEKFVHRMSYHLQLILSRKFSEGFSLQIHGAWTYRNQVFSNDQNDLPSVGAAARFQLSKRLGIILDANIPFSSLRTAENGYYPALGIGFEFDTSGGHVFQINFTNAKGIAETDFIPNTRSNWGDGEYRLGFTISRQFKL
jgi:hypothetical protein